MKKALVAAILGIALNVATSQGQGYITMASYKVVAGTPVFSGVTYGSSAGANAGKFVGVNSGFKADLLFSLTGAPGSYALVSGSTANFWPGSTDGGTPTTDGAGIFVGPTVTIPGYTSGSVSFIVEAYNGSSYGQAGKYNGQSLAFTIPSLQTDPLQVPGDILNNTGTTVNGMQPFVVNIPEPTTFALAGLGAAALMIFRRKK